MRKDEAEREIIKAWMAFPERPENGSRKEVEDAFHGFFADLGTSNSPLLNFRSGTTKWQQTKIWVLRHERIV